MNQIYIIGAGAIGKALAIFLQEVGKKVVLVRGSVDNLPTEKQTFSVTDQDGRVFEQEISVSTLSPIQEIKGWVLITTKTFANSDIAQKLKHIPGTYPIVLLQNGLNVERPFQDFEEVYRCVLFSTSQVQEDGQVSFKTVTASPIGLFRGHSEQLAELVSQIDTPYFGFRSEAHIDSYVWEKAIINCAFNTICPLLEVDNGVFHRNDKATHLARKIIGECVDLAQEKGITLDKQKVEEKLLFISKKAEGQLISTYVDILKKRRTEIESLNLEIAHMAEELGRPDLVPQTRMLGEMIRVKAEMGMAGL